MKYFKPWIINYPLFLRTILNPLSEKSPWALCGNYSVFVHHKFRVIGKFGFS